MEAGSNKQMLEEGRADNNPHPERLDVERHGLGVALECPYLRKYLHGMVTLNGDFDGWWYT